MASDYYSILGVTPAAEDVVIRAAYRALMRHYHPDTNPDPEAQERAREITAAFAVLRDPAKRAEYDAHRAGDDLWFPQHLRIPPDEAPRPAMRGAGLASAALALALVAVVWSWPQPNPATGPKGIAPTTRSSMPPVVAPIEELEPESVRLARLRRESAVAPAPAQEPDQAAPVEPPLAAPAVVAMPARTPAPQRAPTRMAQAATPAPKPVLEAARTPKAGTGAAQASGSQVDRLATLDRMATGFFSQSMVHANAAKQNLLLSARNRSAAQRSACRSDSCVTDAYLRQMREISAIMEGRPLPQQ